MGMDPVSLGLLASSIVGAGVGIYGAVNKPKIPKMGPPPVPVEGGTEAETKKVRKYRSAAQLFRDEDLRLGAGGQLGM